MLADPADFSSLRFPLYASHKMDGIRATIHDGIAYSRSMKPLPNHWLQQRLSMIPGLSGCDGEFIVGPSNAPDVFRQTTSHVMSDGKRDFNLSFHVFDQHDVDGSYLFRLTGLRRLEGTWFGQALPVKVLEQTMLFDMEQLDTFEAEALALGYEGVMTRDPGGHYKQGRATAKGQELLKIKRATDMEAVVLSFEELQHNGNARYENEIGRGARSSAKAGKTGLGTLGALNVRGLAGSAYDGIEFSVGGGFDASERVNLWAERDGLAGKIAKIKYFPIGALDRPRHPIFIGWRDPRDL